MRFSPHSRLSGIVTVQSFIYIKLYPTDLAWKKAIVSDVSSSFGASLNFDDWKVAVIWSVPSANLTHNLQVLKHCVFRILDSAHTALVCASIWIYLIKNFGDTSKINDIPEYVLPHNNCLFAV
jgi:hypothetical protein